MIKDCVVCGIINDVRARLLRETDLYLTKAVDICRASEVRQSHVKALHEEADVAVNKIKVTKMKTATSKQFENDKEKGECKRCGSIHEVKKCPAYGKICNQCKLKNNFSRMCRSQKQRLKLKN